MIRRPPRSTLFPTRRSSDLPAAVAFPRTVSPSWYPMASDAASLPPELPPGLLEDYLENTRAQLDRKSTRLNSSHLVISYAVFCLKKKTKRRRVMRAHT